MTTTADRTYEILCGWDILYEDDPATYVETMQDCLDACDAFIPSTEPGASYNKPCIAVTFTDTFNGGNNCWLHYGTDYQQAATAPYYDAAILVGNGQ